MSVTNLGLYVLLCIVLAAMAAPVLAANVAKPLVGAYYFPGWYRSLDRKGSSPAEAGEWRGCIMKNAEPRPLCGFYDDSNPRLWKYYREWMIGSGINFVAFDWYYNAGQDYLEASLHEGFMAKEDPRLKFCIHWCNHGGPWWSKPLDQSKPALLDMIDLACKRYFGRSDYLRVDGKPVFMIYTIDQLRGFGGDDEIKGSLRAMRDRAKQNGFPGLYIVSVYSSNSRMEIEAMHALGFDAFCAYTYCWMRGQDVRWDSTAIPYESAVDNMVENLHPYVARIGREVGIPYWPSTFSGWDDRPRAGADRGLVLTDNRPELFGRMLRGALKQVNPASPVVMIEAWNEWGEGACIEPSKAQGFGFLREIARSAGIANPKYRTPTGPEIASWSNLNPDELKLAKENEAKPWPERKIIRTKLSESREVPDVKLPMVVDFGSAGVPDGKFERSLVELSDRNAEGVIVTTTGGDPGLGLPIPEIPTRQIRKITVEAEAMGDTRPLDIELFFATARMPDFSQFAAVTLPPLKDGKTSIPVTDIMSWPKLGTPLTRVRIDFGSRAGVRIRLRRLVFE